MFCVKCGARVDDGSKFCQECGAPVRQPEAASGYTPDASQGEVRSTPPDWQDQLNRQYAAPSYPQQQQTNGAYRGQNAAPGKKKKFPVVLAVIAAVVVVLGVFTALKFKEVSNFAVRTFAAPEKYYQHVEKDTVAELSASAAAVYDNAILSNADLGNERVAAALVLEVGDAARDLLSDLLSDYLDSLNPGDDLSWLKTLSVAGESSSRDEINGTSLSLRLNGTDLLSIETILDVKGETAYVSVPQLSSDYIELEADDLYDLNLGSVPAGALLSGMSSAEVETFLDVLQALPDDGTVEKLLTKYLSAAVGCIDEVKKDSRSLAVNGVSADYTTLTVTADGETLAKIVETVATQMLDDRELKGIIVDIANAAGEDGDDVYDNFIDSLNDMLDHVDDIADGVDGEISMTVYVDAGGEIHGRVIAWDDGEIRWKMPEAGGKFGLEFFVDAEGTELLLSGGGMRSGGKLNGDLELEIEDVFFGTVTLEDFDRDQLKKGNLKGSILLSPSETIWSMMGLPSSARSFLRDFSLRLDMDTGKTSGTMKLSLLDAGDLFLALSMEASTGSAGRVTAPRGGVSMEAWAEDISPDRLDGVLQALKRAGVPGAYTDLLEELLAYAM